MIISGCFELAAVPDYDTQEDEGLLDWVEKIQKRVYVTVFPSVFLHSTSNLSEVNQAIQIEILPSAGNSYSNYGYTDDYGYVNFESRTYPLDEGEKITVKVTVVENNFKDSSSVDYDTAKNHAYWDEKNGYSYYWDAYFILEI